MTLALLATAALFAILFWAVSLVKALRRSERVSFLDVLLVFLVTLLPVAALLALDPATPDPLIDRGARWLGAGLAAASLIVALLELRRPGRLRASRGILGVGAGLLLVMSSFSIPFVSAWFSIRADTDPAGDTAAPRTTSPEATLEVEGVVSVERVQAEQLFKAIRQVLAEEIDADEVDVFSALDAGEPLAEIVKRHGGDVERVEARLSQLLRAAVRESAERGEITLLQGALLVSQMDLFVRFAVRTDLNSFRGFGGPTPTGTQPSLLILLTEAPAEIPRVTSTPAPVTATAASTRTPPPSRTPRPTRTPEATDTPRPTRTPFVTRTPQPSATASVTCFAVTNYNLRLRAAPDSEAVTLLTIPYSTAITLTARTSDSAWFATEYEQVEGWVAGEFLTLGPTCDALASR